MTPTSRPPCFECDRPSSRRFYVVPRKAGGRRFVHLCRECFEKADVDIGKLTREAMANAKKRGVTLGRTALPADALALRVQEMRRTMTLSAIADTLNAEGVPTLRDAGSWTTSSVNGLLRRKALRDG